jgi:hypothetical protein
VGVWDFSPANVLEWARHNLTQAQWVPFYVPPQLLLRGYDWKRGGAALLPAPPSNTLPIDVLFYGAPSPRRLEMAERYVLGSGLVMPAG